MPLDDILGGGSERISRSVVSTRLRAAASGERRAEAFLTAQQGVHQAVFAWQPVYRLLDPQASPRARERPVTGSCSAPVAAPWVSVVASVVHALSRRGRAAT